MATTEQIVEIRRLVDEPTSETYRDSDLAEMLAAGGSPAAVAVAVWQQKAAALAGLVDVREGNSERKLSQLYDHAQAQVAHFTRLATQASSPRGTRTRRIERV